MKIYYYINPLTNRTIKSSGKVYKSLKEKNYHLQKDKCLYNSKYAEKCMNRLVKKYPEFKNQVSPIPPTKLDIDQSDIKINSIDELNYINFIKKKYPYILKDPLNTHLTETYNAKKKIHTQIPVGFIVDTDHIIGYIDITGHVRKFKESIVLDETFVNFPFIITLNEEDETHLVNMVQQGIITDPTPFLPKYVDHSINYQNELNKQIETTKQQLTTKFNTVLQERLHQLEQQLTNKYTELSNKKIQQLEKKHQKNIETYIQELNILKQKEPIIDTTLVTDLQKQIQEKQEQLSKLQSEHNNDLERLQSQYNSQIIEHEKELKQAQDELKKEHDLMIKNKEEEYLTTINQLKKELSKISTAPLPIPIPTPTIPTTQTTQNDKNLQEIEELKKIISQREQELEQFKQQANKEKDDLEKELKEQSLITLNETKEQLSQEYEQKLSEKQQEFNKSISELEDTISQLKKELNDTKLELENTKKEFQQKESERIQELEQEKQKLDEEYKQLLYDEKEKMKNMYDTTLAKSLMEREEVLKKEYNDIAETKINKLREQFEKNMMEQKEKDKQEESSLNKTFEELKKDYDILITKHSDEIILVKKQYTDKLDQIKKSYTNTLNYIVEKQSQCRQKIISEKQDIINAIRKYKSQLDEFIQQQLKGNKLNNKKIQQIHQLVKQEKGIIQKRLTELLQSKIVAPQITTAAMSTISDSVLSDKDDQIKKQNNEIKLLNKTIIDLQNEIDKIQITKKQVEQTLIMKFKSSCVDKITKEKTQILDAIDQYNKKWLEYINTEKGNHKKYKSNLKSQLQIILKKIKELIQYKNDVFEKMKKELKNQKEEEIKKLKSQLSKSGLKESELRDAIAQAEKDANKKYSIILSAKEKEYSDVIDNLQFEKSSIEQLNTSLKNENETLKKEQELLKKNKGNLNEEYMSLKQESDNLKSESDNLKSERDNLKSERDNLKSESDELRKNTGSLQKEYDELKSERENLRSERDILKKEHDELTSEYTSLQSEQENLKNENQDLKKAHEELMNELKDLIKVKEEEMEKIRKNELKAQEELDKLKREFDDNLKEIELKIKKTFTDQMLEASERFKKDSDIKENQYNSQIELKNKQISELKDELEKVRKLLEENSKQTKVTLQIDTDSCFKIINNFAVVNNVFNRKLEIIGKLQNIIDKNTLEIEAKQLNILHNKFENVKNEIVKYIQFLDLEKYLNDPNMEYFKSKSTLNKISPDYCNELENLSIYWNENKDAFREQDHILTNIYEDLSGAVRVYIKIKPLLQNQTQAIQLKINDTNTRITVSDQNETKSYGDFYNIYEPEYTNVDMFTGNVTGIESKNLNVEVDTIDGSSHKALYNTFKQVQDGYSIVFFGYGVSGSGKTRVLLGDQNTPGIIHYGLSNLPNIKKISVKNIFEQYIYKFSPNTNNISGKIHHLYGFISELKTHSIDEVNDFLTFMVEKNFEGDLDNFNIKYITDMFNIIEKYRIQQHRIKKTPNNPVSSRSHLFITFEIEFTTGKVGHITMVDAAGREDPKYIFDVFIGNPKTSITSLLSAYGTDAKSVEAVEKYMRPELKNEYQPDQIFEILKESYYITETLNHLVYFFNTKNHIKTKIVTQKGGDKYSTSNYFVSPLSELKISDIKTYNNCLTLPIMEYLEFKNNKVVEFKPNKYVMIVCIRQDQMNTAFSSLDFAQSIKST